MKAFYEALIARHKTRLQALVAVARKLLHAIYGVLPTKTPYDGRKLFPSHTEAIALKVKQEFAANEEAKLTKVAPSKTPPAKMKMTA
jgi:hypothetical protein